MRILLTIPMMRVVMIKRAPPNLKDVKMKEKQNQTIARIKRLVGVVAASK